MNKVTNRIKKIRYTYMKTALFTVAVSAFFLPSFQKFEREGDNIFTVSLNGQEIGRVAETDGLDEYILEARKEIAKDSRELVFLDYDVKVEGEEVLFGPVDKADTLRENVKAVLKDSVVQTLLRAYTVKVNEFTVNLRSIDEVRQLLQASIDKYATEDKFEVALVQDSSREFNVLTAVVAEKTEENNLDGTAIENGLLPESGINAVLTELVQAVEPAREKNWDEYDLGLLEINFKDEVEVVESYLPGNELTDLATAIELVTKDQEKNTTYEVVAGDTLSGISIDTNIPLDKLIEMNENLENENSIIRVGDELIITIPEPELSVVRQEEAYYEEEYDEDVIYVDNDEWYTTKSVTLQEPSAGFRKVIAVVNFENDKEVSRDIVKEEVVMEAVPKIVERGTKIPPTYIKPISGGRQTSTFGYRRAPTRGATSYHGAIDWATPTGTAVFASSSGTVARAGWVGSYGNVIYINHPDGNQTRYAHLSRILVSAGQSVSQGQRIALSGNTGVSTGPHLHFELIINGQKVNPLLYIE